jgi:hypothetical protein
VITWHHAFAKTPPRSQSYQRSAPRTPVETVEDQSDRTASLATVNARSKSSLSSSMYTSSAKWGDASKPSASRSIPQLSRQKNYASALASHLQCKTRHRLRGARSVADMPPSGRRYCDRQPALPHSNGPSTPSQPPDAQTLNIPDTAFSISSHWTAILDPQLSRARPPARASPASNGVSWIDESTEPRDE